MRQLRGAGNRVWGMLATWVILGIINGTGFAQAPATAMGDVVPRDVREIYDRGLQYLMETQSPGGDWTDSYSGPGTTGLALMTFLASGEDPNFGNYSVPDSQSNSVDDSRSEWCNWLHGG